MAEITRYIKHRRDTAANWTSNNPILKAGQLGIETDGLTTIPKFKIGDGVTAWTGLPYFYGGASSAQNLNNVLGVGNTTGGANVVVTDDDIIQVGSTPNRKIGFNTSTIVGGLELVNLNSNDHIILQDAGGIHIDTTYIQVPQVTASRILATDASNKITGAYTTTGSGTVLALSTSPTFVTDITTPLVIGGTTNTSYIINKATTGTGASADPAHIFTGGANGATEIMRLLNGGKVGIGTNPTGAAYLQVNSNTTDEVASFTSSDAIAYLSLTDSTGTAYVGTGSTGRLFLGSTASISSNNLVIMASGNGMGYGITFPSITGLHIQKTAEQLRLAYDASNYASHTIGSAGSLTIGLTGTTPEMYFNNTGGVVIGNKAALATNATDGFLYVPSCAGLPTGVPTAKTGKIAVVVDSTNNKMYIYSGGAWVALN